VRPITLFWVLGCAPATLVEEESGSPPYVDSAMPDESWESPVEHIESATGLADFMFDLDQVLTVELTMSSEAITSLGSDPYTYVSGDIRYGGVTVSNVGVRIKGRLGSYRTMSGKPAIKISVDAFVEDQSLYGLEEINLNNMVQDSSQVHDLLSYALYNAMGVVAPRVGYIWLKINDSDYGLYIHVESYSDPFLLRNFDDPSGNLYDGDYYMPIWGSYTKLDFYESHIPYFEQDEGEDIGKADLYSVVEAINLSAGGSNFDETVGEVVNMDQFNRFWASEMWVGQYDGYNYNINNYRVYFDPSDDGRAMLMPWDHDWAFYSGTPITSPVGLLSNYCRWDESCYASFLDAVALSCDIGENGDLEALLDQAKASINDYVAADPRKEISYDSILYYQEAARTWIQTRGGTIRSTWGIPTD
jgi:spore coat protein CotH